MFGLISARKVYIYQLNLLFSNRFLPLTQIDLLAHPSEVIRSEKEGGILVIHGSDVIMKGNYFTRQIPHHPSLSHNSNVCTGGRQRQVRTPSLR